MAKPSEVEGLARGLKASDAGARILAARLSDVRRHEPRLLRGLDAAAIHDMRVATRRLRAAMRLYATEHALEEGDRAVKELQDALGDVRDGQLQLAWFEALDASPEEQPVVEHLAQAHREAARELETVLERGLRIWAESEAPRLGPLLGHSDAKGRYGGKRDRRALARRLKKVGRLIRAFDATVPAEQAHALRILAKKVRYQAELLWASTPKAVEQIVFALTTLQDALGALHDLDVRRDEVARLSKTIAKAERTGALQLLARLEEQRMEAEAGILDLFVDFTQNERIRELLDALDEAR